MSRSKYDVEVCSRKGRTTSQVSGACEVCTHIRFAVSSHGYERPNQVVKRAKRKDNALSQGFCYGPFFTRECNDSFSRKSCNRRPGVSWVEPWQ